MTVCLFVTANVGSIFEDPNGLLKIWVKEFLKTIRNLEPKFIALHCQEIGGKNYMTSMSYVSEFVRILLSSQELLEFEQIRVFIDEDFKANDKFTALGSLYLVHKNQEAHIWNFNDKLFAPVVGKEIHSGNIIDVPIIEKQKFQQNFFPECKWSRKGFIRTRWLLNGVAFDLINIHLFHDESNFVALSEFPSSYSKNRRKAFEFTLNLMKNDNSPLNDLPQFIFGDFNFRLDTQSVVQRMTNNAKPTQILSANGEISRLIYRDTQADRHLTVEKKHFMYSDPNYFTNKINIDSLREHDKELSFFDGLFELKIDFPPSYPFKEEITSSGYMNTRCPAWCDRVLMNEFAHNLLHDNANFKTKYELMGLDTPMGDHKPVYLLFNLLPNREPKNCEKLMLTHLLSHQTREQTELCSNGVEESVHLSGPNRKSTENNQSSHFNSISLDPLSTPNGKSVQCNISGQCFIQSHSEPAPKYFGDLCSVERGVHPIPRHYPFGKWRFWKFSKSTPQRCPSQQQQSVNANLEVVSSTATDNSLSITSTTSFSSKCNASLSLSISKSECDSHVNSSNHLDGNPGSTDSNYPLPHLSYIGRFKRYCLCCIL